MGVVKSWIEVSAGRLAANFRAAGDVLAREAGPDAVVLAVVKANAYGHGAGVCATVLTRAGAQWLGVTDATEGVLVRAALRAAGVERQPRVLVMCGHLPEDAPMIVRHGLTPVVWTVAQMKALAATIDAEPVEVHLEIDSGMSRQGVALSGLETVLAYVSEQPKIRLGGVMTHFASAEVAWSDQTEAQREVFAAAVERIAEAGLRPAWLHAGNTSALDNGAKGASGGMLRWLRRLADRLGAKPIVRAGLGLYGYALPLDGLVASDGDASQLARQVLPVMTWKARFLSLIEVEAGARIGYNGSFVAERPMRLALLPVGYADGLRREMSSTNAKPGGWVMVRGRRAPIVGRVSMNLMTVDVSASEGVAAGDEAVLLGEGITADDHAAIADTIAYDILCGVRAAREPTS